MQSQLSELSRSTGHVDVFKARFADLPDDGRSLSDAERERAARFVHARDAARFRAGRAWARRLISAELGVAPGDLPLTVGRHGKPELPGNPINFNLTHTTEQIWLAVSDGPVGIDLELPPDGDPAPLFRQIAAPEEWLRALAAGITAERFLVLWTAKEAVLKLLGTGLMTDPRTIALGALDGPGPKTMEIAGQCICLQRLPASDGAVAHVATTGNRLDISLHGRQRGELF